MSPKLQVKLLRVLQEREFEPVGSDRSVRVDVRVIAATNRDLLSAVKERRFREDLFYRLNVLPIHLPPLRERKGDIALLVGYFLQRQNHKKGVSPVRIETEALVQLEQYRWPGNVREIENLIERLVILNEDGVIRVSDLPEYIEKETTIALGEHLSLRDLRLPPNGVDLNEFIQTIEDQLILQALSRTGGNKTLAAELLRLNRTTLIERMRKKGLVSQASAVSAISTWGPVRKVTSSEYSLTA
jgi:transcriptional regulator with GAF, ATPase, and Fis domain